MKKALISIVLPIYNIEKYLTDCIESVINQTYKNIEIILVDDGSEDNCGTICDNYANKDKRIKVIHKENGGLSDARNAGLKIATGEYITFIDSDDIIDKKYIENLFKILTENNADIAICNYKDIGEKTNYKRLPKKRKQKNEIEVFDNIEGLKQMYTSYKHGLVFVAWAKLYKKELFIKNNIEYPKGKIHEDTYTTYKLMYYAKKIVFSNEELYFYRIRTGSIMNSEFSLKKLDKLPAIEETCEFFFEKDEIELLKHAFNDYMKVCMKMIYEIDNKYKGTDKVQVEKEVIEKAKIIYDKYKQKCEYPFKKKVFYSLLIKYLPFNLKKYAIREFFTQESERENKKGKNKERKNIKEIITSNKTIIMLLLIVLPYLKPYNVTLSPILDTIFKIWKVISTLVIIVEFIKKKIKLSISSILGISFALIWGISIYINCGDVGDQLQEILSIIGIILFFEVLIRKKDNVDKLFQLIYVISEIYIILQLITIIIKAPLFGTPENGYDIYFLGGDNRSAFILLPLAGLMVAHDFRFYDFIRLKTFIYVILGWIALIYPFAVTGLFAYAVFMALIIFINNKKIQKYINPKTAIILIAIFIIGVIFIDIQEVFGSIFELLGKKGLTARETIWKDAFEIIKNNWLIGIGKLNHEQIHQRVLYGAGHAHNIILEILMDTGIIGSTIFCAWVGKLLKNYKENASNQTLSLISCFTAFILCGTFDFYLGLIYFYILLLTINVSVKEDKSRGKVENK